MERRNPARLEAELRWMRRLATELAGSAAEADELVQEAWCALDRSGAPIRRRRPFLAGMLRRIAWRRRRGEERRRGRERAAARDEALPSAAELAERLELQELLVALLKELREPLRSTLVLRYHDGLSAAEIARRRGVPAATVRSHVARGLAELRRELDARSGGRGEWRFALAPWLARRGASSAALLGGLTMKAAVVGLAAASVVAALVLTSRGGGIDPQRAVRPEHGPQAASGADAATNEVAGQPAADLPPHRSLPGALADTRRLVVRTLDSADRAVGGAEVHGLDGARSASLGTTDAAGALTLTAGQLDWEELVATAPGHACLTRPVPAEGAKELVLRLRPAGEASGRVVRADGSAAGAGIHVLAWSEHEGSPLELARRALRGDPRAMLTTTDDAGEFVLRGLDAEHLHSACAGGAGLVGTDDLVSLRAGMSDLELVVEQAYAARVRLREPGGAPLSLSHDLYGRRYGTARLDGYGRRSLGLRPQVLLALDGVGEEVPTSTDRFYLFTSDGGEESLGPVRLALDWPGYEPLEARFEIPMTRDGRPAEIQLTLRPAAEARCELELVFEWPLAGARAVRTAQPWRLVQLTDTDGRAVQFALREAFPASFRIPGLPRGLYSLALLTPDENSFEAEQRPLTLDDGTERVEVDLSALGAVELLPRHRDGSLYRGRATVRFHELAEEAARSVIFLGPPYVVSGLPPGAHELWIDEPRFLDRSRTTARSLGVTLQVEPGRVIEARLALPE